MKLEQIIAKRTQKTIYRDGDTVVKVFSANYSKADVLNEALNTARVEETALKLPKVLAVNTIDGQWAITTEYIEGKTLKELMAEHPEKMAEHLDLFVTLQMQVHAQKAPMLGKLKDKMNRKISATDLDATARYEMHTRLEGMPKHTKLCHGDFSPSNVVITAAGDAYILDWAHATQGNASADVARTYLLFCLQGNEKLADDYLKLYCKKSDTAMQYVQKWLPIVAASQSVKGKPDEREFLLRWVNVVEYE